LRWRLTTASTTVIVTNYYELKCIHFLLPYRGTYLLVIQTDTLLRIPVDVTVTNHNRPGKSCEHFTNEL